MNYEPNYANIKHEIAGSEHDFADVGLNIGNFELDGGGSGHDFGNVGHDFNDFEQNR